MLPYRTIVVEVTGACPLRCRHCYNPWRDDRPPTVTPQTLTRAEIRALVRRLKEETALEQVALSGGEPLLRADLPEIVQDILDEGLAPVVITSGALLTETRVARLPRDTVLEVTLFGADAALHDRIVGRRGSLQRSIAGIARARTHGCGIVVSVVVSALNVDHVGAALELGIALGAEQLMLNRMNLTPKALADRALQMSAAQLERMLAQAEQVAAASGAAISVSVPVPPCVAEPANYPHLHFGWCPRGGADAYYTVSHDGLLRPCNHSSRVLGSLRAQSFSELTGSARARAFWSGTPAACSRCTHPLRDACRGGCPAAADECYGTRERWDPLIDIALAQRDSAREPALA